MDITPVRSKHTPSSSKPNHAQHSPKVKKEGSKLVANALWAGTFLALMVVPIVVVVCIKKAKLARKLEMERRFALERKRTVNLALHLMGNNPIDYTTLSGRERTAGKPPVPIARKGVTEETMTDIDKNKRSIADFKERIISSLPSHLSSHPIVIQVCRAPGATVSQILRVIQSVSQEMLISPIPTPESHVRILEMVDAEPPSTQSREDRLPGMSEPSLVTFEEVMPEEESRLTSEGVTPIEIIQSAALPFESLKETTPLPFEAPGGGPVTIHIGDVVPLEEVTTVVPILAEQWA